jgi:CubicO group peptidase (beta-lactamase class C family)
MDDNANSIFRFFWPSRRRPRRRKRVDMRTPLEGWSMGKSITATLFGILLNKGVYQLTQPAPIPEWQTPGDPRAKIRIEDLLHMSSGLRIRADPSGPYPDHLYLYTGGVDSYHYAATRPQQWPPNAVGRYRHRCELAPPRTVRFTFTDGRAPGD